MEPSLAESSLVRPRVAGLVLTALLAIASIGAARNCHRHHHHRPASVTMMPMHAHGHLPQFARCRGLR